MFVLYEKDTKKVVLVNENESPVSRVIDLTKHDFLYNPGIDPPTCDPQKGEWYELTSDLKSVKVVPVVRSLNDQILLNFIKAINPSINDTVAALKIVAKKLTSG